MIKKHTIKDRQLNILAWLFIVIHAILRISAALATDLGIDEAYYIQYARYPDWAYFDHPPLVGWLIWLTTAGGSIPGEIFVRLGPLLIGTASLYVVYRIGRLLQDRPTGLIALMLTASSFYHSVIVGVFILPDTTQSICWLLALWSFLSYIKQPHHHFLWLFGIAAGLAMLSKYHGIFLIGTALLYLLITTPKQLASWRIIPILLLPLTLFLPVVIWNLMHGLISFDFHGARIGNDTMTLRPDFLIQELAGQLCYNNPLNVVWIVAAGYVTFRKGLFNTNKSLMFLLCSAIPLLITVLCLSLFNHTLPHWSGPAYYGLILVTAYGMSLLWRTGKQRTVIKRISYAGGLCSLVIIFGIVQVRTGGIPIPADPTLDLYGWPQITTQFDSLLAVDFAAGRMDKEAVLVTGNWFPAGQLDYYVGVGKHRQLVVAGTLENQHQYHFINDFRGGFPPTVDCYFLSLSRYRNQLPEILNKSHQFQGKDSVNVLRAGKPAYSLYIYRFRLIKDAKTKEKTPL